MVLALAMFLVGLNPDEFNGLITSLTPNASKLRAVQLQVEVARALSPSGRSESSGIGSITSSCLRTLENASSWPTPTSSRSPSVRSADGCSTTSSTAPSIRSIEGSVASLTPSSSRAPSVRSCDGSTASPTPVSRPITPNEENPDIETTADLTLVNFPTQRRDILDLISNIREPGWLAIHPLMTSVDPFSCIDNDTVDFRIKEFNVTEDYPARYCGKCDFGYPSPYLFENVVLKREAAK